MSLAWAVRPEPRDMRFLSGGGELGAAVRTFDWSSTPLGPVEVWPASLRTAVQIMLSSAQPAWIGWGPDLTCLFNDACGALLRDGKSRALGRPVRQVWREIWDDLGPALAAVLTDGKGTRLARKGLAVERDGVPETIDVTFSCNPVGDEGGGDLGGVICFLNEDSEHAGDGRALRATEAALREASERIELALNAGAVLGTWVWDIQADRFRADERFARTFCLDPALCRDGVPFSLIASRIHPDDLPGVAGLREDAISRGSSYRAEYRVAQEDGSYRWLEANGRCEHDSQGRPVRFPGVLIDIDERRRVEERLRERETDLQILLDATAEGFYAVDRDGMTTRCNAAFLRMLGFKSDDEVLGRRLQDLLQHSHADGSPYLKDEAPIYVAARTGEPAQVADELFYRLDGSSFPVEYWVRPVYRDGELRGAVCNFIDITERKRGEEGRQLLLRELNHRVKNLFAIATGMVTMSARSAKDPAEMGRALNGRLLALARAHELIRSAISPQAQPAQGTTLHDLVDAVIAPHLGPEGGTLSVSGPGLAIGPTAATSLALVLHELATNAAKYGALSLPGGRLDMAWGSDDQVLTLTWTERDGKPLEGPPARTGFGSQLATLSARGQLGGDISFDWQPAGLSIVLTASLERISE